MSKSEHKNKRVRVLMTLRPYIPVKKIVQKNYGKNPIQRTHLASKIPHLNQSKVETKSDLTVIRTDR